jgi:hypothetical protein
MDIHVSLEVETTNVGNIICDHIVFNKELCEFELYEGEEILTRINRTDVLGVRPVITNE